MAKYSAEFKLKVALEAAQGVRAQSLAQVHGIDRSTIRLRTKQCF